jgi:hypothetical protein
MVNGKHIPRMGLYGGQELTIREFLVSFGNGEMV